jgi:hypothetical protein
VLRLHELIARSDHRRAVRQEQQRAEVLDLTLPQLDDLAGRALIASLAR